MAAVVNYTPANDYISLPRRQSEDHTITQSPFPWDQGIYGDLSPLGSQSYDLMDMSPGLSSPLPWSNSKYSLLLREPNPNQTLNPSLLFGDYDNLMGGWEDPTDSAHSLVPERDPAEPHVAQSLPNERDDSAPLEDRIYSTPPSWERPRLDCRVRNGRSFAPLSPDEESRLLAIAMPTQTPPITPPLSPSPEPVESRKSRKCNPRKRKSSESSDSGPSYPPCNRHLSPQKSAHNMVEKRYRTNLNHKIALLRDSVPTMRVLDDDKRNCEDSQEDLQGLQSAQKLNKSTILTKAVEYIDYLVKENKSLAKENKALKCAFVPSKYL